MYKTVAIAGTFDRLHKGHRYFISEAFKLGGRVVIGLTSDNYVKQKLETRNSKLETKSDKEGIRTQINNFQTRKKELEEFLKQNGLLERAEIVKIEDVYGPAVKENEIEALVVTAETLKGGQLVNKKRMELELKSLKLLKVSLILAQDKKRIASTRIRLGEIDRWGKVFQYQISKIKDQISDELRIKLKKPLGLLVKGDANNLLEVTEKLRKLIAKINSPLIITVGDEVTKICNRIGIMPHLSIVDFRVQREEKYRSLKDLGFKPPFARGALANGAGTVQNPPGHITGDLVDAIKDAYWGIVKDSRQRVIKVDGEEDLAGVPAVLLAPLGSIILYGQPHEGIVAVEATEEKKQELITLINGSCQIGH